MQNVPVEYGVGLESKFGMTNASGEIAETFTIAEGDRESSARIWDGEGHTLTQQQVVTASSRYDEITKTTYSDRLYVSAIPVGATTHVLTIDLKEAVKISFRFTNSLPPTSLATVTTRLGHASAAFQFTRSGTLRGVRKQTATQLCVIADTPEVWIRPLTVAETTQDTDLGDFEFPQPACTAPVTVTMTNHTDLWASPIIQLRNMATFIKKDDGRVFISFVNRTTNQTVEKSKESTDQFKLPPGDYYVLPGCFGADIHWKAYDLVKAGQQSSLDAVQIPTITAADAQTATLTVDAKKVMEDIRRIP